MSDQNKMDYKNTINLPKTPFSMKANLANRESGMVKSWEEAELYARTRIGRFLYSMTVRPMRTRHCIWGTRSTRS